MPRKGQNVNELQAPNHKIPKLCPVPKIEKNPTLSGTLSPNKSIISVADDFEENLPSDISNLVT